MELGDTHGWKYYRWIEFAKVISRKWITGGSQLEILPNENLEI